MAGKPFALCSTTLDTSGRLIAITTFNSPPSAQYSGGFFNTERVSAGSKARLGIIRIPARPASGGIHTLTTYVGSDPIPVDGVVYDVCLVTQFKYDHTGTAAEFTICALRPLEDLGDVANTRFEVLLRMQTDNTLRVIVDKPDAPSWTELANPATTYAENVVYTLEFRCIFGSSNNQDYWGVFIDGILQAEGYADLSATGKTFSYAKLGPYADGSFSNDSNVVVSFKDPALFRDGRPNPGRMALMVPNGAGTHTAWTGTYADVDEVPTDSDTTYITSSTNGQKESYLFGTTLGVNEAVDGLQVFIVDRIETNARYIRLFSIVNSVEAWRWPATAGIGDSSYDSVRSGLLVDNPQTSLPWTKSDLASMQLGLELSSGTGTGVRVSTFVIMAWVHVPPTLVALTSTTFQAGLEITENTPGSLTTSKYSGGWFNAERQGSGVVWRFASIRIPSFYPAQAPNWTESAVSQVSSAIGDTTQLRPLNGDIYDITLHTTFKYDYTGTPTIIGVAIIWPGKTDGDLPNTYYENRLNLKTDGTLELVAYTPYGSPTSTTIANPATTFAENTEYKLTFRCCTGSGGGDYWAIYIDGVLLEEGIAKLSAVGAAVKEVSLGKPLGGGNYTLSFRDPILYKNGLPEDGHVAVLHPNGAGTYSQWTGSYTDVDDTVIDDDTTYIRSVTDGQKSSFAYEPFQGDVYGLQVTPVTRYENAGAEFRLFSIINSVENERGTYDGGLGFSYQDSSPTTALLVNNPETGLPWITSDIDTMEFGVKLNNYGGEAGRVTALAVMAWAEMLTVAIDPVVMKLAAPYLAVTLGSLDLAPVVVSLDIPTLTILQPSWSVVPVVIRLADPGQNWLVTQPIEPVVISLADPGQSVAYSITPDPTVLRLAGIDIGLTMGSRDLQPVVVRLKAPSQGILFERYVLPTTRGNFWVVSATAPPYPQEGYVWVSVANPAAPVMYQYLDGAWTTVLGGFEEAATRIVFDAGAASTSATPVSLANLTGLSIPADEHIIIEATILNVNGSFDITGLSIELNNVAVMSGVAMPGTGTGEAGTWRVIIPRRDQAASLGGYSYLTITDSPSQTVTALTNVPQNTPITSIELIADPNSTSMELRNVLVRSLKS